MAKRFDAELSVLSTDPNDWAAFLCPRVGIPLGPMVAIDTDLTLSQQADRLWRVDGPVPAILHVEFESSGRLGIPHRLQRYNVLAYDRLPVHSAVVLLRPEANASDLTGELIIHGAHGRPYHIFRYEVVRLWMESMDNLLAAGPSVAPLAVLTDEASRDVSGAFDRVCSHLQLAGLPVTLVRDLVSSAVMLAGLRYNPDITDAVRRRMDMTINIAESSTYQQVLKEGNARGRVESLIGVLLRQGQKRFGPASPAVQAAIRQISDSDRLDRMADRVLDAADWNDLLSTP